jgi:hypothetical protein
LAQSKESRKKKKSQQFPIQIVLTPKTLGLRVHQTGARNSCQTKLMSMTSLGMQEQQPFDLKES